MVLAIFADTCHVLPTNWLMLRRHWPSASFCLRPGHQVFHGLVQLRYLCGAILISLIRRLFVLILALRILIILGLELRINAFKAFINLHHRVPETIICSC